MIKCKLYGKIGNMPSKKAMPNDSERNIVRLKTSRLKHHRFRHS